MRRTSFTAGLATDSWVWAPTMDQESPGSGGLPDPERQGTAGPPAGHAGAVTSAAMAQYAVERFSEQEVETLRPYFTNVDRPVFGLVNLPEVVKGALFARYSRTHKSLRRLFLDEFVGELDTSADQAIDASVGLARAEQLYDRVFYEYGDDSVAQLGGVHLACEQASNLLTKVLEWGRLMAYLEQSTRYISYDARLPNGRYRYYRDQVVLESAVGARYVGDMDRMFDTYAELLPLMQAYFGDRFPKQPSDSDFAYRSSIRAKAFDALRGLLPAAAQSNVGVYGTGQGYEMLLLRMRAHPLPEARAYAEMMLEELRKVIPSFLKRVDVADRGGAWSAYLERNRSAMERLADELLGDEKPEDRPMVTLVDFDPDAEDKLVAAALYPYTSLPEDQVLARVRLLGVEDKVAVLRSYAGDRTNRRHKPGRGLERIGYRFDVLSDYGAFRDLQRHRMLTIEWQDLGPYHGYVMPDTVVDAGAAPRFEDAMERSAALYEVMLDGFRPQAAYAVALAYRVRYVMQ